MEFGQIGQNPMMAQPGMPVPVQQMQADAMQQPMPMPMQQNDFNKMMQQRMKLNPQAQVYNKVYGLPMKFRSLNFKNHPSY